MRIIFEEDMLDCPRYQARKRQNQSLRRRFERAGTIKKFITIKGEKAMEIDSKSALAGAPFSPANISSDELKNYTLKTVGASVVSRLLKGENVSLAEINLTEQPFLEIAQEIFHRRNGRAAAEVLEEILSKRSDGPIIRAVLLKDEPDQPLTVEWSDDGGNAKPYTNFSKSPEIQLLKNEISNPETVGRWLSAYIDYGLRVSPMSPRSFHQMMGLSILSAAIARRVFVSASNRKIFPNLFSLIVADSTVYCKTTALELADEIMHLAGLDIFKLPAGITPQSLIGELTRRAPESFDQWEQQDKTDWRSERIFAAQRIWLMDEMSSLLDSFDQKIYFELLPQILRLFGCPKKLVAKSTIRHGRQTINNGYLTICGPTTPTALRKHIKNPTLWENGFFARFIFVTPDSPPRRTFYPPKVAPPEKLIDTLRNLTFSLLPMPMESTKDHDSNFPAIEIALAPGVWQCWDKYHEILYNIISEDRIPAILFASYGRFHDISIKVATLLAVVDWAENPASQMVITLPHWYRAQTITEEFRASLHRVIKDDSQSMDKEERTRKQILRFLRESPSGLSSRELANYLNFTESENREALDLILARMLQDNQIERGERKPQRGPVAKIWKMSS